MAILVLVSVLAFSLNGTSIRLFQTRARDAVRRLPLYQSVFCLIAALLFAAKGGFALPSLMTLLYGIAFGVFFCLATAMSAKGFAMGSMALTSLIINMSLIIPMLYSILFEREPVELLHVIGFLLFFASLCLSAHTAGDAAEADKKRSRRAGWLWLCVILLGFFSNGFTATLQKNYALHSPVNQDEMFLAVAYVVACLLFAARFLANRGKPAEGAPADRSVDLLLLIGLALTAGLGSFGGNLLLGILSTEIPGAILYPCINGGLALCTSLISFTLFREKPTAQKLASLVVGCGAIVVLNLA